MLTWNQAQSRGAFICWTPLWYPVIHKWHLTIGEVLLEHHVSGESASGTGCWWKMGANIKLHLQVTPLKQWVAYRGIERIWYTSLIERNRLKQILINVLLCFLELSKFFGCWVIQLNCHFFPESSEISENECKNKLTFINMQTWMYKHETCSQ